MHNSRTNAAGSAPDLIPIVIRFGRLGDMVLLYRGHEDVARIWSLFGRHTPFLLGPTGWRAFWALRRGGKSPIYVCETSSSNALERINALFKLVRVEPGRCMISVHAVFDAWRSLPVRSAVYTVAQIGTDSDFKGKLC
jgi:hypothetical protein